jgi:lipoyl(octanoyl) transferase
VPTIFPAAERASGITSAGASPELIEPGVVDYHEAWRWQQQLHTQRRAATRGDVVLLLEHPSVYTAGKRTAAQDRPRDGSPVVEVNRGGKITWHGPGQLVGYPIIELPQPLDVLAYVRRMERLLIDACAQLGVATNRIEGRTGVWVPADSRGPARKIAAIGVRVSFRITLHGFALNCNPDLSAFDTIVPCGIPDAAVTSLSAELGSTLTVADALPAIRPRLAGLLRDGPVRGIAQ